MTTQEIQDMIAALTANPDNNLYIANDMYTGAKYKTLYQDKYIIVIATSYDEAKTMIDELIGYDCNITSCDCCAPSDVSIESCENAFDIMQKLEDITNYPQYYAYHWYSE